MEKLRELTAGKNYISSPTNVITHSPHALLSTHHTTRTLVFLVLNQGFTTVLGVERDVVNMFELPSSRSSADSPAINHRNDREDRKSNPIDE